MRCYRCDRIEVLERSARTITGRDNNYWRCRCGGHRTVIKAKLQSDNNVIKFPATATRRGKELSRK